MSMMRVTLKIIRVLSGLISGKLSSVSLFARIPKWIIIYMFMYLAARSTSSPRQQMDSVKSAKAPRKGSHFSSPKWSSYSETSQAQYSICKNLSLSLPTLPAPQETTNRIHCLALTMHALGVSFYLCLASRRQEGRGALVPVIVLEVEGILSPRGTFEKMIN